LLHSTINNNNWTFLFNFARCEYPPSPHLNSSLLLFRRLDSTGSN